MITIEQFNTISQGDVILFSSGKQRQVLNKPKKYFKSIFLQFYKIRGTPEKITTYTYYDLKDKIIGVFRIKKLINKKKTMGKKKTKIHMKKIWLVTTSKYNFTIVANSEEECKELVDELSEGTIITELKCESIGHIAPTMDFYSKEWQGESFIVASNFEYI